MRLPVALLLAVVACGTSPGAPRAAAPTTLPVRALPSGALAPGTYATARARRLPLHAFRTTRGLVKSAERNHAIVVSATNADFRTVYDEGHRVVFSMRIGP
jgi:hypothetical protein